MKDCRKLKAYNEKNKANSISDSPDEEFMLSIQAEIVTQGKSEKIFVTKNENWNENLFEINSNDKEWILDSGATCHITCHKELYSEFTPIDGKRVKVANGHKLDILGKGSCKILLKNDQGKVTKALLTNVIYVPEIKGNSISIGQLTSKGFQLLFYNEKADLIFN